MPLRVTKLLINGVKHLVLIYTLPSLSPSVLFPFPSRAPWWVKQKPNGTGASGWRQGGGGEGRGSPHVQKEENRFGGSRFMVREERLRLIQKFLGQELGQELSA